MSSNIKKNNFSLRLKENRELKEMSQGDLAKKSNLQPSAISHFETGKRKPSFDNLRSLADALEVTTDYLLGRTDNSGGLAEPDQLHRHMQNMTESDKEFAMDMLERLAQRASEKKTKQ
jgi:transcriptional regulator with XRE-family HTH domain